MYMSKVFDETYSPDVDDPYNAGQSRISKNMTREEDGVLPGQMEFEDYLEED